MKLFLDAVMDTWAAIIEKAALIWLFVWMLLGMVGFYLAQRRR